MKLKNDKKCSRCKEVKNLSEFTISNKSKDKHQNYCKKCRIEYSRTKKIPSPHKEVREVELEILQMEILRWKNKFLRILDLYLLDLYLNEGEIL